MITQQFYELLEEASNKPNVNKEAVKELKQLFDRSTHFQRLMLLEDLRNSLGIKTKSNNQLLNDLK